MKRLNDRLLFEIATSRLGDRPIWMSSCRWIAIWLDNRGLSARIQSLHLDSYVGPAGSTQLRRRQAGRSMRTLRGGQLLAPLGSDLLLIPRASFCRAPCAEGIVHRVKSPLQ